MVGNHKRSLIALAYILWPILLSVSALRDGNEITHSISGNSTLEEDARPFLDPSSAEEKSLSEPTSSPKEEENEDNDKDKDEDESLSDTANPLSETTDPISDEVKDELTIQPTPAPKENLSEDDIMQFFNETLDTTSPEMPTDISTNSPTKNPTQGQDFRPTVGIISIPVPKLNETSIETLEPTKSPVLTDKLTQSPENLKEKMEPTKSPLLTDKPTQSPVDNNSTDDLNDDAEDDLNGDAEDDSIEENYYEVDDGNNEDYKYDDNYNVDDEERYEIDDYADDDWVDDDMPYTENTYEKNPYEGPEEDKPYQSPESTGEEDPFTQSEGESFNALFDQQHAIFILGVCIFTLLPLILCTYLQFKNNPEGLWASLCRCLFTMVSCIFKIIFLPCRYICCKSQRSDYEETPQPNTFEFNPDFSRVEMS